MQFATFRRGRLDTPVVATAVHNGHELRPEIARSMRLGSEIRLREEDPYTDFFAVAFDTSVVVHRSRFEVDLNRPRTTAIYLEPADAWGLELWKEPLSVEAQQATLSLYDKFLPLNRHGLLVRLACCLLRFDGKQLPFHSSSSIVRQARGRWPLCVVDSDRPQKTRAMHYMCSKATAKKSVYGSSSLRRISDPRRSTPRTISVSNS